MRADRERLAEFATAQDLARLAWRDDAEAPPEAVLRRRPVQVSFSGVVVEPPPGAFLQPTLAGERRIVEIVTSAVAGAKRVADLYAGCGTISFAVLREAGVHAVEGDAASAEAMQAAARRAGCGDRLSVEVRDLARRPIGHDEIDRYDAVVFDPPHAGARAQAEAIADSKVPTVVAVSCNPATLARDLRILVDGGYVLERLVPIDQFLWSAEVEAVAVLRRS